VSDRYVYEASRAVPGEPTEPTRWRPPSLWVAVAIALVVGLVSGAAAAAVTLWAEEETGPEALVEADVLPASEGRPPASAVTQIADRVLPTVVQLTVRRGPVASTGSGFIVDRRGYVVTNSHVVSTAVDGSGTVTDGSIVATFSTGQRVPAELVGRSPTYDLAVLRVEADNLPVATLGESGKLRVGDPVVAVGAPLGLTGTVTTGIVSALDRPVTTADAGEASYISAIQTDAAINPGNSGGPLVDRRGNVVGITTSIATLGDGQSGSIGLGFAIPITKARAIVTQLISEGEAQYPVVGVILDLAYQGQGARVQGESLPGQAVTPGGPADLAGIEPGDRIVAVDGEPVQTAEDFVVLIRARSPGDQVELTISSGDVQRTVQLTLGSTVG
jgi:putative serine protease PepD